MNERIRELAEQAGADFMRRVNYNNLEGEEYEEDAGVIFESNESFEKFAELIVKECIRVPYDMWDKAELNADVAVKIEHRIKEHFGVEE
jgi:hypothetical protein